MADRKPFLLRLDPAILEALQRWANDDLRSLLADEGLADQVQSILADADSDGAHIATLLCALFVRHFRPLVENGHVFVAMPPLFRVDCGKQVFYALDEKERDGVLDRIKPEWEQFVPRFGPGSWD